MAVSTSTVLFLVKALSTSWLAGGDEYRACFLPLPACSPSAGMLTAFHVLQLCHQTGKPDPTFILIYSFYGALSYRAIVVTSCDNAPGKDMTLAVIKHERIDRAVYRYL